MTKLLPFCLLFICSWHSGNIASASSIIEDGSTIISDLEFEVILDELPREVLTVLQSDDVTARWEVLNELVTNKRTAAQAHMLSPEEHGADYWKKELMVQTVLLEFMEKKYLRELKLPDFGKLARERYDANKEIAAIPEGRRSSHILLACSENCDKAIRISEARELRKKLLAGEKFETLVKEYSDDPGSRKNGGKIDAWIVRQDPNFVFEYVQGLYSIKEVGSYSKIVLSNYGVHIIRLDEIRGGYLTFREIEMDLRRQLQKEYRVAKMAEYRGSFSLGDSAKIYAKSLDRILKR